MSSTEPVIIMAAPTGARLTPKDHPNLPITPTQLAAEARRCVEAGASAIHLHARDDEMKHSLDSSRYQEVVSAVKDAVGDDLLIQITTESVGFYNPEGMMAPVLTLFPDAVSVAIREIVPSDDWKEHAIDSFHFMKANGIWPQIILFDAEDVKRFRSLQTEGMFPFAKPYLLFVLGRYTVGQKSSPEDLDPFLEALGDQDDVRWGMCAFGEHEHACARRAMELGGDVRVGFENNRLLPNGLRAEYTSDSVALAAKAAEELGRPRLLASDISASIPEWIGE